MADRARKPRALPCLLWFAITVCLAAWVLFPWYNRSGFTNFEHFLMSCGYAPLGSAAWYARYDGHLHFVTSLALVVHLYWLRYIIGGPIWWPSLLCLVGLVMDECGQLLIPWRQAELGDFCFSLTALLFVISLMYAHYRYRIYKIAS